MKHPKLKIKRCPNCSGINFTRKASDELCIIISLKGRFYIVWNYYFKNILTDWSLRGTETSLKQRNSCFSFFKFAGLWIFYILNMFFQSLPNSMNIGSIYFLLLYWLIGRFDLFKYHLHCNTCGFNIDPFNIDVILKSGYWPGSPTQVNCMIDQTVFRLWDSFRKRMPGSSEKSFMMSLSDISLMIGRVSPLL